MYIICKTAAEVIDAITLKELMKESKQVMKITMDI